MEELKTSNVRLIKGDCLEVMESLEDKSINMILCDLPYGTTTCKWDTIIAFEPLWEQYNRIIKDNGAIVLFAKQPFASKLVNSNLKMFRYELIWEKEKGTDFGNANRKPLNAHENICVFYRKQPTYNVLYEKGKPYYKKNYNNKTNHNDKLTFLSSKEGIWDNQGKRNPKSVIKIASDTSKGKGSSLHPCQKPIQLLEWLIKSYTNENDTVLDNTMGSGSTGVACINTNRKFIGIEKDKKYFDIAYNRINGLIYE